VIFVTVGTHEDPFDRLLEGVRLLPAHEEVIVQHGPSAVRPPGARCVDYLPFDEMLVNVRRARVVVSHAGVGSLMVALANGHRPIVMARLSEYGEHVDNHQLPLARRLADTGIITLVDDAGALADAVAAAAPARSNASPTGRRLAQDLRIYLEMICGPRGSG
jgi:UDP-N-acetylglucosamine transferase subunit ALG13